jgi:hypothetical protein
MYIFSEEDEDFDVYARAIDEKSEVFVAKIDYKTHIPAASYLCILRISSKFWRGMFRFYRGLDGPGI